MARKTFQTEEERDQRLRLTTIPSYDQCDLISIYSKDKHEVAKQLVDRFKDDPKAADKFDFRKLDLSGADLSDLRLDVLGERAIRQIDFTGANLSGQNFSGMNLTGAQFRGVYAEGLHMDGAKLGKADMDNARFIRSDFSGIRGSGGAKMQNTMFSDCNLSGDFRNATMVGVEINRSRFVDNIDFTGAKMAGAHLYDVEKCADVNFNGADLTNARIISDMKGANFTDARLHSAEMEGRFEQCKFKGADVFDLRTAGGRFDEGSFDEAVNYGSIDKRLEVAVPKPSFGSKVVLQNKALKQLDREDSTLRERLAAEAPTMTMAQTKKRKQDLLHEQRLRAMPKPGMNA